MPSTSLFGCRLRQLATDNTFFYFMIAIVQVVWLFIYGIGIAAFSRPEPCDPGTQSGAQHWPATFICLAFFLAQAAITVAATLLTLKGTPLEPGSKRRWVAVLSYAYLASLPLNVGLLAWACWVDRASDGSCWSSGDKAMPTSIFFGGLGVLLGQAVGLAVSYNQLSDVRHGNTWHSVTRTGVSSLLHLCGGFGAQHRGPWTNLEEIVTQLQQLMRGIDADKTDVVAGLACAALLQDEAAAAGRGDPLPVADADVVVVAVVAVVAATEHKVGQSGTAGGAALSTASIQQQQRTQLLAWADGVCRSAAAALPEASAATAVAQGGGPASSFAPASVEEVGEALRWARFATAAYGARQHAWRRGKQGRWAARRQLASLTAAAAAEGAQPLAGWAAGTGKPGGQPSKEQRQGFAAARQLLGAGAQIVSYNPGHEPSGLLPHLVAVDREKRAVVLGIAGSWQRPHAVPAVQTTELPEWLTGGGAAAGAAAGATAAAAEAGLAQGGRHAAEGNGKAGYAVGSWVRQDSLEAAEALLGELRRHRLLHHLLRPGAAVSTDVGTAGNSSVGMGGSGGDPSSALAGMDCTGWRVVVSGHGLGAGAAALLALKLQAWELGPLSVWAHGPPVQLCSPDLAARLAAACSLTSVVVGDDASPRASSAALGRLVEQSVVGLARLRYSKTGLLAALIAERLGPKRWAGRWYNHRRALRPLSEAPAEALEYLQRFRDWQEKQGLQQAAAPAQKPSSLPGRVLWLSRRAQQAQQGPPGVAASAAAEESSSSSSGCSSSSGGAGDGRQEGWQAAWMSGEEVAGWDIRVSRCVLSDHYVSRLLGVLGDLGAGADLAGAGPEATATAGDPNV